MKMRLSFRVSPARMLQVLCVGVIFAMWSTLACAQDDVFNAPPEPTPIQKPVGTGSLFSFAKFESGFRAVCRELESDGRRERFVKIAEVAAAQDKECISCRSLWRTVMAACERRVPRPRPSPKATKTPKANKDVEVSAEAQVEQEVSQDTPVPPTPTQGPKRERYPSTALLDAASKMSTEAFQFDEGQGQVSAMFRYLAKTVRETKDLSSSEREYFDIFLTYLLAAWEGRIDPARIPTPTPVAKLESFFD